MDYKIMSKAVNQFGRLKWKSNTQFELALNSTKVRNLLPNSTITDDMIKNFGPFTRLHFENRSTEIIRLCINGIGLGDDSVTYSEREWYIQPDTAIDIIPEEDNLVFTRVAIVNVDAANNTSNNELLWSIANN